MSGIFPVKAVLAVWLLCCFWGCGSRTPGSIGRDSASQQPPTNEATDEIKTHPVEEVAPADTVQLPVYSNDVDRLEKISQRVNRAMGVQFAVMFGSGEELPPQVVSVDYAAFSRLDDAGVAAMIAEAMLKKAMPDSPTGGSNVQTGPQQIAQAVRLDERAGFCVAQAGFEAEGFDRWLDIEASKTMIPFAASVSVSQRREAFMRGFLAGKTRRDKTEE